MAKGEKKAVMEIDLANLDKEWQEQPMLAEEALRTAAGARLRWEELKIELDVAYAEADKAIREHPGKFGVEKVTETAIKGAVELSKKVLRKRTEVIEAKHALDLAEARCRALEHRKRALENEVHLFLAGYFAAPKNKRATMSPTGNNRRVAGVRDEDE